MTDVTDTINKTECLISAEGGEQSDREAAIDMALELSDKGLTLKGIENEVVSTITKDWFDPSGFNFHIIPMAEIDD